MNKLKHIAVVIIALFLLLGLPVLYYTDVPALLSGSVDAVSSATIELPDQPSGEYVVLLNKEEHGDTADQWNVFFSGEDAGVIMNDIKCAVMNSDAGGIQLAERYKARLAENQMQLKRENPTLLASKAENGIFDAIVLSKEMAEAYGLQGLYANDGILCVRVKGE